MNATTLLNPVLWLTISAFALWVPGAYLLAWSLLAGHSVGRRRCPKCWYDMRATEGMRCPECGRVAKRERSLHRCRIRKRFVVLAMLLLMAGWASRRAAIGVRDGWWSAPPRALLVAGAPVVVWGDDIDVVPQRFSSEYLWAVSRRVSPDWGIRSDSLFPGERWLCRSAGAILLHQHPRDSVGWVHGSDLYTAGGGTRWDRFDSAVQGLLVWQIIRSRYASTDECSVVSVAQSIRTSGAMPVGTSLLNFRRHATTRLETHGLFGRDSVVLLDGDATRVRYADATESAWKFGGAGTLSGEAFRSGMPLVIQLLHSELYRRDDLHVTGRQSVNGTECIVLTDGVTEEILVDARTFRIVRTTRTTRRWGETIRRITEYDSDPDPLRFIRDIPADALLEPVLEPADP